MNEDDAILTTGLVITPRTGETNHIREEILVAKSVSKQSEGADSQVMTHLNCSIIISRFTLQNAPPPPPPPPCMHVHVCNRCCGIVEPCIMSRHAPIVIDFNMPFCHK